jgi:hypothetical protein
MSEQNVPGRRKLGASLAEYLLLLLAANIGIHRTSPKMVLGVNASQEQAGSQWQFRTAARISSAYYIEGRWYHCIRCPH